MKPKYDLARNVGNADLLREFCSHFEFSFSFLFWFQLSCGKSVKYRFTEFFIFDYDSLPYVLLIGGFFSFSYS